jgi:hypothetical protein
VVNFLILTTRIAFDAHFRQVSPTSYRMQSDFPEKNHSEKFRHVNSVVFSTADIATIDMNMNGAYGPHSP